MAIIIIIIIIIIIQYGWKYGTGCSPGEQVGKVLKGVASKATIIHGADVNNGMACFTLHQQRLYTRPAGGRIYTLFLPRYVVGM